MKIKYTLDLEDLVFYNLYFFDKSPGVQRRLKLQKLGISVFVITSSILLTYFTGLWYVFLSSGCVVLFYVFTSLVSSTKNQLEKSVRSYYESEEARKDFGEKEVELTETGISFPSEGAEGEVAYSEIFKIEEVEKYLFIYLGISRAYIINKRSVFEGEIEEFKKILLSKKI